MRKYYLIGISLFLSGFTVSKAQISFPFGNILNLNTQQDFLYLETRVIFNTGIYKANDYKWEKISDSLDQRWFVTACFNGDCRNDLLQSGQFLKDFGLNDTSCFIAFHVETKGFTGKSVIKYKVINIHDPGDNAILIYNITYTNVVKAEVVPIANGISFYPNPFKNSLAINIEDCDSKEYQFWLFNMEGVVVKFQTIFKKESIFDFSALERGIYFYSLENKRGDIQKGKLIKE